MNKQPLIVKTGANSRLAKMVKVLLAEAGYEVPHSDVYTVFRFGGISGCNNRRCGGAYELTYYEDMVCYKGFKKFDARTEMGKLIDFVDTQKTPPLFVRFNGSDHMVLCDKDGDLSIGCACVDSLLFDKIVAFRQAVMKQ